MAGLTLTERVKASMSPRSLEQAANISPLRRLPAPEEVASTIVFLASAANTTVNGEIVLSSGGQTRETAIDLPADVAKAVVQRTLEALGGG